MSSSVRQTCCLARRPRRVSPEQNQEGIEEGLEIVIGIDRSLVVHGDLAEHLDRFSSVFVAFSSLVESLTCMPMTA